MKELLQRIICTSLNNVFSTQPTISQFVPQETAEREPNVSFHFANELWKFLFWLDCDFDVTKKFHEDKRPDMVFHKRGINALNFLVVEVKRKSNQIGFEADVAKIKEEWFDGELQYQFGASVVIDENTGDYELRLMERGSNQPLVPIRKVEFNIPLNLADLILNARKMLNDKVSEILKAQKLGANTTTLVRDLNDWACRAYSRPWNIDDIVVGTCSKKWLEKKNLLPSSWGLKAKQAERIKNADIRLTVMYSPASLLKLEPNPLKDLGVARLVIVDANTFEHPDLSREENIATMLHEIGHVFHELAPPTEAQGTERYMRDKNEEGENAADDFAHSAGYGKYIVSSLEKLAKIYPKTFDTPKVKARIKRMEEKTATKIGESPAK